MPKEENHGCICRTCYLRSKRKEMKNRRERSAPYSLITSQSRNLAISQSESKSCKYCGAPAMGGGRGAICRECYNRLQREKMKETYIPHRKYSPCKICGTMTRSQAGICNQCQGKKMPAKQNNSKEDEKALLETAVKYNREHPFHPAMMQNLVIAMQRMRGNCQPSGHYVTRR